MSSELRQIRSVHRALDLLEHLGAQGPCSLQKLHTATGLSKSTLRRLLATLVERRFVRRGMSDGMYRTNVATPSAVNSELTLRIGRLVEVARPHMLALTDRVEWPSDLHIYVRGRMRILESTHGMSPFGRTESSRTDAELNLFAAASGLAFLASSDDQFVLDLVEELKHDEFWSLSRFGITPARLLRELNEIRQKGFAVRRITQGRTPGRNAIAVAILQGKSPVGGLTISWQRQLMPAHEFAALHLDALQAAAKTISKGLTRR
ncbi:MAG: helix-turn-helix domain-containing protein [Rhizobiales bacterium]|nr:helix-turn-helix domain-containing protein [Hyphomicrobiales bacterium]